MSRIDDEAQAWVVRQAAGTLAAHDQAAFAAWYAASTRHQGAYLRALAIAHAADAVPARPGNRRRTLLVSGALAASVAAVTVTGLVRQQSRESVRTVVQTSRGDVRTVALADRSTVTLNSDSRVDVALSDAERRIELARGEAWFAVAKDKARPFIVVAGAVRVRAVGTAFAVQRREHGAQVLVSEGVVEVWSEQGGGRPQRIVAGASAFVDDAGAAILVQRDPAGIARRLAWRDGQLVLQDAPLAEAVADFNRYNVRQIVIADPALRQRTLVGHYRIDQPEHFAADVRALWRVPVVVTADTIRIGATAGARRPPAGG